VKVAEIMRADYPSAFLTLSTVPTTYHKVGTDHYMYYRYSCLKRIISNLETNRRPIIDLDENSEIRAINYSPPFEGTLAVPFPQVEAYYAARRIFSQVHSRLTYKVSFPLQILKRKDLGITLKLAPGDMICFNNR
jgi:hypothetical protein